MIGGGGTFENDVQSELDGQVIIDAPITGTGTLALTTSHGGNPFEFKQSVGAGQTVQLFGGPTGYQGDPNLTIDDLTDYQATTQLGWGEITLTGLHADSYTLANNTLTLYQNGNQVGQLANFYLTGGPLQAPTDFGVSQTGDGIVVHGDGPNFKGAPNLPVYTPPPPPPPPDQDTYQYLPPGGTLGPVTPINGNTIAGGPGAYSVHGTGLQFIASEFDEVGFTQGSNFDLAIQAGGGVCEVGGSWNLSIANSGAYAAIDANPANGNNMFVVGSPVVAALAEMEPTDNMFLQGVHQSDIDQAFARLAANPQQGPAVLSLPRAGGSALALVLPNQTSAPLLASQFHAFG